MRKQLISLLPRMRKYKALSISAFLILGVSSTSLAEVSKYTQYGYVSWYGRASYLHTATGRSYNHNDYCAASKTLPFGTKVLVENLENKRKIIVKIVDRGPYVRGRTLDLFYGAAKALHMIKKGVIRAKIVVLGKHYVYHKKEYAINKDLIKELLEKLGVVKS